VAAALKDLLRDLARALEEGDRERIARVRRLIADGHSETSEAAEASYKLGLDALFLDLDLDRAVEHFRKAAKTKSALWSQAARVSLGMALFRQGKQQQAIFELRKAAGQKPPTIAAAHALAVISGFLRQMNNAAEADRARAEQMKLLVELTKSSSKEDAALAHYMLGVELKYEGKRADARRHFEAALGGALDPTFVGRAKSLLGEL
jgi:tetratricopeptide (TPR) repeat protein